MRRGGPKGKALPDRIQCRFLCWPVPFLAIQLTMTNITKREIQDTTEFRILDYAVSPIRQSQSSSLSYLGRRGGEEEANIQTYE
jgi:hypothetical protein